MLVGALSFSLGLISKRPLLVVVWLFVALAFAVGVDVAAWRAGYYTWGEDEPVWRAGLLVGYYLVRTIVETLPSTVLLVAAVMQLGLREPSERTNAADWLRQLWLNVLFVVIVLSPITFATTFAMPELLKRWGYLPAALVTYAVASVVQALLFFGFAFAWPHAVVARRAALFHGWRLARGRYWKIAAVFAPLIVLMTVLSMGAGLLSALVGANLEIVATEDSLVNLTWLIRVVFDDSANIFGAYLLATCNAYLYARLMAAPEKVAEAFS